MIASQTFSDTPQGRYYRKNRKKILEKQRKERGEDVDGKWRKRRVKIVTDHMIRIGKIKTEAGCQDCKYDKHSAALDFDHRPGTVKLFHISQMSGRSLDLIAEEIAKCDIVCANCHRIRSYNRRRM